MYTGWIRRRYFGALRYIGPYTYHSFVSRRCLAQYTVDNRRIHRFLLSSSSTVVGLFHGRRISVHTSACLLNTECENVKKTTQRAQTPGSSVNVVDDINIR